MNDGLQEGLQLKEEGIARAVASRKENFRKAQFMAIQLAPIKGELTTDDVKLVYEEQGGNWIVDIGPAAGAIFRNREVWEPVGYEPSSSPKNHARINYKWKLKNGN